MELTYVLAFHELEEEQGREVVVGAGSDFNYLEMEAIEQSSFNEEVKYTIEAYVTTGDVKCELAITKTYFAGKLEETFKHPVVAFLELDI